MLPPVLKSGDKIGITAFAKKISKAEIELAISTFESWGLQVVVGKTIGSEWNQFAGTDKERAIDLQEMLDDTSVKAIISARGGYGSVRIIDQIDFTRFKTNPKWLIGFSDVTTFHNHINQNFSIPTIHGTMPVFFEQNSMEAISSLKEILFNGEINYCSTSLLPGLCKDGTGRGEITGGNLSIIYSLCGSPSQITTAGKILFLEDLCEYLYATDRMLQNLKRNNYFSDLAGVIIGGFTDMNDGPVPFGATVEELLFEYFKDKNIPIFTGFEAGHISNNKALLFGKTAEMVVLDGKLSLKM